MVLLHYRVTPGFTAVPPLRERPDPQTVEATGSDCEERSPEAILPGNALAA